MKALPLDANGYLPLGHEAAKDAAAKTLADLVNELPESVYHLGPIDAEWVTSNMLQRYLHVLKQANGLALTGADVQQTVLDWINQP
jgi:hypothetical protein